MDRSVGVATRAVGAVAVLAGAVAFAAAAYTGDRHCENLADAKDPSVRHDVCGPFLETYEREGGRAGLGLPLSGEQPVTLASARPYGDREMPFSRGTVYLDTATGETSIGRWEFSSPLD